MKHHVFLICGLVLIFSCTAMAAVISKSAEEQMKQLDERAAKASESSVGEYARELLDVARLSLAAAKVTAAAGMEKETIQKIELAETQLNAADAKAAEKEMIEKLALHRSELKKSEAQLERYRQGEGN